MASKLRKYIAEQPHTPNGFRYKTPILVSDSKGFTIRNACQDDRYGNEYGWCVSVYNQRLDDICKGYRLFHKIFGAVISRRPFPWACAVSVPDEGLF
jgi:hypothetical protein